MLVDIVTRSNNKVPYYERLRDARHCIQLRFDKIESPFGTSSIHNTNDQPQSHVFIFIQHEMLTPQLR